jgi:selenide,water dikinase
MKRLLLAGGGHAHVEVLRRMARSPIPGCETVLVTPTPYSTYSGMLPGLIAGHYGRPDVQVDLLRLCHAARVRLLQDRVTALDAANATVTCADGSRLPYDVLSLDIGSIARTAPIANAERVGVAVKPIERLLQSADELAEDVRDGLLDIAVIGAGAGGVELCFALAHRLRRADGTPGARFTIVTESPQILPGYSEAVRSRTLKALSARGIGVHVSRRVTAADEDGIALDGGGRIRAQRIVWVTGPAAPPWLAASGLTCNDEGFVLVKGTLQSISHPNVLAAGDVATVVEHPRPKSGVYAVRQGPPLARNLRAAMTGAPLAPFHPQRRALQLISTGDRCAIAAWGNLALEGRWVWRWKDWIDRRFIARYA